MTIKDAVLAVLGPYEDGLTAQEIHQSQWPMGATQPTDWRSVNRVLHKLEKEGLVKSQGKHLRKPTVWRLK